jgi:hypothetical protein
MSLCFTIKEMMLTYFLYVTLIVFAQETLSYQRFHQHNNQENPKYMNRQGSLYELERELAAKELAKSTQLFQQLKAEGYEIRGFYHTSTWQHYWAEVITEQLYLLDGYRKFPMKHLTLNDSADYIQYRWDFESEYFSLLNISDNLVLNVAITTNESSYHMIRMLVDNLHLKHRDKIIFNYNRTIGRKDYELANKQKRRFFDNDYYLSVGEYSTITALHQYCTAKQQQGQKAYVYYFHSKGSCCMKSGWNLTTPSPVSTWREEMNAMLLEYPSICLRALHSKGYVACGVENQDAHFSGNFWFANCAHISKLSAITDRYDFMAAEMFVLRGVHNNLDIAREYGRICGYSVFNCHVNLYLKECPRYLYRNKLVRNLLYNNNNNHNHRHRSNSNNNSNNSNSILPSNVLLSNEKEDTSRCQQLLEATAAVASTVTITTKQIVLYAQQEEMIQRLFIPPNPPLAVGLVR